MASGVGSLQYPCSSPSHANRSTGQRNTTQSSTVLARLVCPHVCDSDSARVPASPPYACSSPSHANRSTGQRNTTQSSAVLALPVCPHVCDSDSARVPASPPYVCSHANRSTGQRNTTQSSTARTLCARMCEIAIALEQQHPPSSPPSALPSLPPSSWLTTSSFTSVRWSDSSTQAAAGSVPYHMSLTSPLSPHTALYQVLQ